MHDLEVVYANVIQHLSAFRTFCLGALYYIEQRVATTLDSPVLRKQETGNNSIETCFRYLKSSRELQRFTTKVSGDPVKFDQISRRLNV